MKDKNGQEYSRIYVQLDKSESVDKLMKCRPLELYGQPLRITRNIPKKQPLHDRSTTGIKITILNHSNSRNLIKKLNKNKLVKYCEELVGIVKNFHWMNDEQTEALLEFDE
jgi:hypothetical protein